MVTAITITATAMLVTPTIAVAVVTNAQAAIMTIMNTKIIIISYWGTKEKGYCYANDGQWQPPNPQGDVCVMVNHLTLVRIGDNRDITTPATLHLVRNLGTRR